MINIINCQECNLKALAKATSLLANSGTSTCRAIFSLKTCRTSRLLHKIMKDDKPFDAKEEEEENVGETIDFDGGKYVGQLLNGVPNGRGKYLNIFKINYPTFCINKFL